MCPLETMRSIVMFSRLNRHSINSSGNCSAIPVKMLLELVAIFKKIGLTDVCDAILHSFKISATLNQR